MSSIKEKFWMWLHKVAWNFMANRFVMKLYEYMLWNSVKRGGIPKHIAVILDGNRRWALSKGLDAWDGYLEGANKAGAFLDWCYGIGKIQTVTLYIFSTENFNRQKEEVENLMRLMESQFKALMKDKRIHEKRIRVKVIGKVEMLPPTLQKYVEEVEKTTQNYDNYYLNLAIAYGGRAEIVDALRKIASKISEGKISSKDIDERVVEEHLYTGFLPNPHPDLIIRTSGEERLSNFLLWQSAYSELCFLDVFWPGFRKIDLLRAINVYQQRQRKFGV